MSHLSSTALRSPSSRALRSRAALLRCSVPRYSTTSASPTIALQTAPLYPLATENAAARRPPPPVLGTHPLSAHQRPLITPLWFNSTLPLSSEPPGTNKPDPENERKVQLGKTLRILQPRLPTLLQSPLPSEILAPNISLHLFPSTHPYLPVVSGRVAYVAALWTSPIAWNRVPIIGNLKLDILSARMTSAPVYYSPRREGAYPEQLVVKWRTAGKKNNNNNSSSSHGSGPSAGVSLTEEGEQKLDDMLRGTQTAGSKKEFTGLFIFEFDKDGRVLSHTIEHVDKTGDWEQGVGAKVVHLTDWLLGGIKGSRGTPGGALPSFEAMDGNTRR